MYSFPIKSYVIAFCFSVITPVFAAENNGTMLPEPAQMLSTYVQIPSVSGQEKEAGEFFSQFCRDNGLHVHILTDEADSYNFVASLYPLEELKPNIVLLSHIDVVPAGDEDSWTYPPFSGMIADGMVWGRGAIDNKAMGVMHVYALLNFVERAAVEDWPFNVSLLAVSGEETGGDKGARIVADRYLDVLNPVAVYGEGGAGLQNVIGADPERVVFGLAVAQKRILWLSLESSVAASGHGSVPRNNYPTKEVINATSALLGAKSKIRISPTVRESLHMVSLHERGFRRRIMQKIDLYGPLFGRFIRNDPLFRSMLTNTMSLTSLTSTDGAYNMIPTRARAVFDCRLLPETSEEKFLEHINRTVEPYDVTVNVIRSGPPTPTSEQGHFYEAMEASLYAVFDDALVVPFMFVAINDNRFFRRKGIPAYGLLPSVMSEEMMESIHYFDERMPIDGLEKGIEVYKNLINILLSDQQPALKFAK